MEEALDLSFDGLRMLMMILIGSLVTLTAPYGSMPSNAGLCDSLNISENSEFTIAQYLLFHQLHNNKMYNSL